MADLTPITREETLLAAAAGDDVTVPNPISREELFLAKLAGMDVETPNPVSRKELFLQKIIDNKGSGGGGGQWTTDGIINRTEPNGDIVTNATYIPSNTFRQRTGITSFTGNNVTKGMDSTPLDAYDGSMYAFAGCTNLKSVEMINFTDAYCCNYMFYKCTSLQSISMPNLTKSSSQMFKGCTALKSVVFPKLNYTYNDIFMDCTSLEYAEFGVKVAFARGQTFKNCTNLKTVVLRGDTLTTIEANAFDGTPFASGGTGGTVYVPSALIESYQTATNWAALYAAGTCTFAAIEGSEYE